MSFIELAKAAGASGAAAGSTHPQLAKALLCSGGMPTGKVMVLDELEKQFKGQPDESRAPLSGERCHSNCWLSIQSAEGALADAGLSRIVHCFSRLYQGWLCVRSMLH